MEREAFDDWFFVFEGVYRQFHADDPDPNYWKNYWRYGFSPAHALYEDEAL